jgi:hypothetical protein
MILKYELTAQDYMDFNFYFHWTSPDQTEARIVKSVTIPICIALYIYIVRGPRIERYGTAEVMFLSYGIIVAVLMGRFVKWNIKRKVKNLISSGKNTDLLGMKTLHLEEDKLIEQTDNSKSEILWSAFEKFKESKDHFFLFIHVNQAIIVPKRALSQSMEIDSFRNFITQKIR